MKKSAGMMIWCSNRDAEALELEKTGFPFRNDDKMGVIVQENEFYEAVKWVCAKVSTEASQYDGILQVKNLTVPVVEPELTGTTETSAGTAEIKAQVNKIMKEVLALLQLVNK